MIQRIYVDTSVVGGCLDHEFGRYSRRLLDDFDTGRFQAVISNITVGELRKAPAGVRALMERPGLRTAELVYLDDDAQALAREYVSAGVVGEASLADAQHIAIATVNRVDILVSWNFKHIVKLARIRAFNAVNLRGGYPELEIRSPLEVFHEED
jgi:predicted nucleic acid-binding protein